MLDTTLHLIVKAVNGIVLMSPELDLMYKSLLDNQVPGNWQAISYPSLKPLGSWIKDLNQRVEFMRNWQHKGHPKSFWLSGFYFTHGFITGVLQTYARKHSKAIDLLEFKFKVVNMTDPELLIAAPNDGVIVYGMFIEGAAWNFEEQCLEDQTFG